MKGSSMTIKRSVFWTLHALCTAALLAALILLMSGCDAQQPAVELSEAFVHIEIVDNPGADWPAGAVAITRWAGGGVSKIEILRPYYPECITHEVRHVFEGDWHVGPMHCR